MPAVNAMHAVAKGATPGQTRQACTAARHVAVCSISAHVFRHTSSLDAQYCRLAQYWQPAAPAQRVWLADSPSQAAGHDITLPLVGDARARHASTMGQ